MWPTKCMYIIKYGLAPYFKDLLLDTLKESSYYTSSFDKSYNKTAQKGQMDMLIRYQALKFRVSWKS